MDVDRLPASVATLYAELLEQAIIHERVASIEGQLPGGPVTKLIRERRYLYWQVRKGDQVAQRYLGPDSDELRDSLRRIEEERRTVAAERTSLDRLAAMLLQGGALRENAGVFAMLRLLADLGTFRRGGVLIGTVAFSSFGSLLAVRLPSATLRTQDIDVAHESASRSRPPPSHPSPWRQRSCRPGCSAYRVWIRAPRRPRSICEAVSCASTLSRRHGGAPPRGRCRSRG